MTLAGPTETANPSTRAEPLPKTEDHHLTEAERRAILEEIARNPSNRSAQIQALRFLKELDDGKPPPAQGFDALD